jgi:hypothetical protein
LTPSTNSDHASTFLSPAEALLLAENWEGLPGERQMVAAVLRWLTNARWLGSASWVAFELPWRGRRIDLLAINGNGRLSAFEFKLGGTRRVFEQAIYNSGSVHRSYVVSAAKPKPEYQEIARTQGLGVFVVNGNVELLQRPRLIEPSHENVRTLRDQVRQRLPA